MNTALIIPRKIEASYLLLLNKLVGIKVKWTPIKCERTSYE